MPTASSTCFLKDHYCGSAPFLFLPFLTLEVSIRHVEARYCFANECNFIPSLNTFWETRFIMKEAGRLNKKARQIQAHLPYI
jgi:hypothetical protein